MNGTRMKQARLACGLTLDALAERMTASGHPITKAGLSKYELSKSTPKQAFIVALSKVLSVRAAYFTENEPVKIRWIAFRKLAKMSESKQEQVKAAATHVIENQLWLQNILYPDKAPNLPKAREASTLDDAEEAATRLRKAWGLDDCPIDSLTGKVEDSGGVVVACADVIPDFDGLAGRTDSGFPVAVVSMNAPDDRRRYNLAHELGHLLLDCNVTLDLKRQEELANRFASALLVPANVAKAELGNKRTRIALSELELLKAKYGLSMQGWVRRAHDLEIIDDGQFKNLCIMFSRNRWKKVEPYPFQGNETPSRLKQMTIRAYSEGLISAERAEQICPLCTTASPMERKSLSAADIRRMPREHRAALLASASATAESEYASNRKLTDFEAYGEDDLYDDHTEPH